FGRRRASAMSFRNVARRAVALDEAGVMDRQVGCALLEGRHGIAPLAHHFGDELVSPGDGTTRAIDERFLQVVPLLGEHIALLGAERTDVEVLDTLLPFDELGFGRALVVRMGDRPVVLAPVLRMESLRLLVPRNGVPNDRADDGE